MKKLIIILVLILSFQACKKDRLKEDKSILIGTWNWVYTEHYYGWCDGESYYETLTPESESEKFSIEFLKNGIVKFYSGNEELIEKKRIVFDYFKTIVPDTIKYSIKLNNKSDELLSGGGGDTFQKLNQYPFKGEYGCEDYDNYFVKQ